MVVAHDEKVNNSIAGVCKCSVRADCCDPHFTDPQSLAAAKPPISRVYTLAAIYGVQTISLQSSVKKSPPNIVFCSTTLLVFSDDTVVMFAISQYRIVFFIYEERLQRQSHPLCTAVSAVDQVHILYLPPR